MGAVTHNDDYRFDLQLARGLAVEGWFYELTAGGDRFEVKNDRRAVETGRVFVECSCDKGRTGRYALSGINTTEADCWIFALGEPVVAFVGVTTERLRMLVRRAEDLNRFVRQPHGNCPTTGVAVPLVELLGVAG